MVLQFTCGLKKRAKHTGHGPDPKEEPGLRHSKD
jgi:hypothetical protein